VTRWWGIFAILFAALALSPAPAAPQPSWVTQANRQILVMVRHPPEHFRPNGAYGGGYGDEAARSARERLARRIAGRYQLALVDAWPMPMIGYDCFVMAVPDGRTTAQAIDQVSHDADVAWSQPVGTFTGQSASAPASDPLLLAEPAVREWHLTDLHRIATGRGVKVAVVDSGVDDRHPDLAGQVAIRLNFVSGRPDRAEAHGTSVAGIIAAKAGNGVGIAGVAPHARILALRACWQGGAGLASTSCDSFSLAKALYFAISEKSDVINLSLSGPEDRLLAELLKVAVSRGATVVTAFDARRPGGGFPATVPGAIAVSDVPVAAGATRVYIAPGRDVPTTEPGGRWFLVNGSSFAAAHVSGLVALVEQRQRDGAVTLVTDRGGPIDACATLLRAAGNCDCTCGALHRARSSSGR
jgi:subtilisin family serine protease